MRHGAIEVGKILDQILHAAYGDHPIPT